MTYRFILFSEETENFVMEIKASPSATFLDLHNLIIRECGYEEQENHIFSICDENWKIKEKVYLRDTGTTGYDEDLYIMENTTLEELVEEEGQKIAYLYDGNERKNFLMELVENMFGEKTGDAYVSRRKGTPPTQVSDTEETDTDNVTPAASKTDSNKEDNEESADDTDSFAEDELDVEGFEITEM